MAPPAPSLENLLVPAGLDIAAVVLTVAAGALYLRCVRRLAARGRRWRRGRSAAFAGGLVVLVVATQSGLARYDTALFSAHVVQHVLLGMMAPVLLVAGAPLTLALQAGGATTTAGVRRALHHPVVRALTHPVTAAVAFSGTLVVVYCTPLYEASLRHDALHAFLHVHFVVAGFLWAAAVVGADPHPVRLGHLARLGLVALTVPVHAILGIALLSQTTVIAADWYATVVRPWGASSLADQRLGAGILWGLGELFGVVLATLVLVDWMRVSERAGRRHDRQLDAALAAAGAAGAPS